MELQVTFAEYNLDFDVDFDESIKIEGGGNTDIAYERGYSEGYDKGKTDGFTEGQSQGLAQGYKDGINDGYQTGYLEGYEAADNLMYATQVNRLFYKAEFPIGYELTFKNLNCPDNISEMFRISSGIKKLTVNIPTNKAYNASYFVYDTVSEYSTLEELNLPSGIKFSDFSNFATRNKHLKAVNGAIDLSESTTNDGCFAYCPELVDVSFVFGTITKSISFAQSTKLSIVSIESILGGLSEVGDGQTLTLSESAVDNAYVWEGSMGKEPGTTCPSWQDAVIYYTEKGWTITLM